MSVREQVRCGLPKGKTAATAKRYFSFLLKRNVGHRRLRQKGKITRKIEKKKKRKKKKSVQKGTKTLKAKIKGDASDKNTIRTTRMDSISKKLSALDLRRQELASELDKAQKAADYESFRKIGNSYLGTILESIDLYIELIKEISSEPVAGELKNELSEIVKRGSQTTAIESQSEWISNDVSPLYEKVRQICACVYAAVAKIDQDANPIA